MASVSIRDVYKSFGEVKVIQGIDWRSPTGSSSCWSGPSGCGKSTLLRMVAGLETITEGEISIDGEVVNDVEPKDRDIAMVFQNYALYPHMTVHDNLAFGLKIRKLAKARDRGARAARRRGSSSSRRCSSGSPRELSGGQRQRVALGRAIVREPTVFLFDEPLSNLDAKLRVQMRAEIAKLHRGSATTMLYVTHDQVEAMTLGRPHGRDERRGRSSRSGAPLEVYERPANALRRGLHRLAADESPCRPLRCGERIGADRRWRQRAVARGAARRSEAWGNGRRARGHLERNPQGVFRFPVETVEALGADSLVHGAFGDSMLVARVDGHETPEPGTALAFQPMPDRLYFFDTASGQRLRA